MKTTTINKKMFLAAGILAALLLIGTAFYLYLRTPVHLLAIDVNPSIELRTDRLNRVVSINPVNEDAVNLMSGYQLEDRDLEQVIEDIVDRMIFFGYLTSDQTNQILITADDTYTSPVILDKVNTAIADYMSERQLEVEVLQQQLSADNTQVDAAHANNISFGKMAFINELTAAGSGLTAEEMTGLSIKDLIAYAVSQGISLQDLIENYNDVLAEQIEATEDAIATEDTQDSSSEDAYDNDAVKEEVSNEDSNEDADDAKEDADEDSDEDADDAKEDAKEDANEDSNEDADEDSDEDADAYEDADSDEDAGDYADDSDKQDIEDSDEDADEDGDDYEIEDSQGEDSSDQEDAYYEDSEDNDSEDQEDGQSYYEEDQDEDNRDNEDRDGDNEQNNWEDNNQQDNENDD